MIKALHRINACYIKIKFSIIACLANYYKQKGCELLWSIKTDRMGRAYPGERWKFKEAARLMDKADSLRAIISTY